MKLALTKKNGKVYVGMMPTTYTTYEEALAFMESILCKYINVYSLTLIKEFIGNVEYNATFGVGLHSIEINLVKNNLSGEWFCIILPKYFNPADRIHYYRRIIQ